MPVSQYSMTLSSSWSLVKRRSTSPSQSLQVRNFSTIQRREPGRRVVERVADRLRLRALDLRVPRVDPPVVLVGRQRDPLVVLQVLEVEVGRRGRHDHVEVDAHEVLGIDEAELRGDHRAPVAALRAVALVAEAGHERRPTPRRSGAVPSPARRSGPRTRSRGSTGTRRGTRRPGRRRARAGRRADG